MKKKNFLRNLSTTALAICSLSSAVALPSSASSADGNGPSRNLRLSFNVPYQLNALVPEYEYERSSDKLVYKDWREKEINNKVKFEVIGPHELAVNEILESGNGDVVIPKKLPSEIIPEELPTEIKECLGNLDEDFEVTQINSAVDFSDVISLGVPDSVRTFDESGEPGSPHVPIFYTFGDDNA